MSRIYWTQAELECLANHIVDHSPDLDVSNARAILAAARQAQEKLLPLNRHRDLVSLMHLRTLIPVITQAQKVKCEQAQAALEEASKPKPLAPEDAMVALGALPLSALLDLLADRLASRLLDKVSVLSVRPKVVPAPSQHHTKKRLHVGIVGLLDGQQKIIASKFGAISFRFYDKSLPKQLPTLDYMIGMVGFLSYSVDGKAAAFYKHKYFRISGGVSLLETKLTNLLNGTPNGAHHG